MSSTLSTTPSLTSGLRTLYRQNGMPILQNCVYDTFPSAQACATGDVHLVEDLRSGLIYNDAFRPDQIIYDASYDNEQANSPRFKQHLSDVAEIITQRLNADSIVEVGCGKGYFLEMLSEKGFEVTGFDPAYEGDNPNVRKEYFHPNLGLRAEGLILRHVLEHVDDPYSFLCQLSAANGGQGRIYIEVPCFDWIMTKNAWFDVFYEHVNYFRLSDFLRMFGAVYFAERVFGGQYLAIVADLATLTPPQYDPASALHFPSNFGYAFKEKLAAEATVIWGGGSKGVIFSLLRQRAGRPVQTVIDINPRKQGKYLPVTGLFVQSPAQAMQSIPAGSPVLVMNSNYLNEIRQMSGEHFHFIGIDDGP